MLENLESGLGLDVVVWLQAHGNGVFDALAKALHFTGGSLFYLIIIPIFYWCFEKQLGKRLFFALVFSTLCVVALKMLFKTPRPDQAFPDKVTPLVDEPGYGIPSGHVTNALVMWGIVAVWLRRRWVWIAVGSFVLLMAWSRMYAGVHYPQDVIVGGLLGIAFLWGYVRVEAPFLARWDRLSWAARIGLIALVGGVLVLLMWQQNEGLTAAGSLMGGGIGAILEKLRVRFYIGGGYGQRALRYAAGLALLVLIFSGQRSVYEGMQNPEILRVLRYAVTALVAMALYPWMAVYLRLVSR